MIQGHPRADSHNKGESEYQQVALLIARGDRTQTLRGKAKKPNLDTIIGGVQVMCFLSTGHHLKFGLSAIDYDFSFNSLRSAEFVSSLAFGFMGELFQETHVYGQDFESLQLAFLLADCVLSNLNKSQSAAHVVQRFYP